MSMMGSQTTSISIVYSTVYSGVDQSKHQNSESLAFGGGIHWRPVISMHNGPVTRKMIPFDGVIMLHITALCKGSPPVTADSKHKDHKEISLLLAWISTHVVNKIE